jgi:hypothetical protein
MDCRRSVNCCCFCHHCHWSFRRQILQGKVLHYITAPCLAAAPSTISTASALAGSHGEGRQVVPFPPPQAAALPLLQLQANRSARSAGRLWPGTIPMHHPSKAAFDRLQVRPFAVRMRTALGLAVPVHLVVPCGCRLTLAWRSGMLACWQSLRRRPGCCRRAQRRWHMLGFTSWRSCCSCGPRRRATTPRPSLCCSSPRTFQPWHKTPVSRQIQPSVASCHMIDRPPSFSMASCTSLHAAALQTAMPHSCSCAMTWCRASVLVLCPCLQSIRWSSLSGCATTLWAPGAKQTWVPALT